MKKQWHLMLWMTILAIGLVGLVGLAGCSDDDDDDNTVMPTIKPYVYAMAFGDSGPRKVSGRPGSAYANVSDCPVIPGVSINGSDLFLAPELTIYGGSLGFYGDFVSGAGNAATLLIDVDGQTGGATISVPGEFDIVGDSDVYLDWFSSHTYEWTASAGAERYWVMADFNANYVDGEGNMQYFENEMVFTTTDTTLTLTAADMFPPEADVDHFTYFSGDLDVTATNGPMEPGQGTNVTGAVTGYFIGIGASVDWDINENVPTKQTEDREQDIDWLGSYVEMMR